MGELIITKTTKSDMTWGKFRKLPIVVRAIRFEVPFRVETREGWMRGNAGDWLIEGVAGELYPCAHDIFIRTYGPVDES